MDLLRLALICHSYIERNFKPPILFRDVKELGDDEAYVSHA